MVSAVTPVWSETKNTVLIVTVTSLQSLHDRPLSVSPPMPEDKSLIKIPTSRCFS